MVSLLQWCLEHFAIKCNFSYCKNFIYTGIFQLILTGANVLMQMIKYSYTHGFISTSLLVCHLVGSVAERVKASF